MNEATPLIRCRQGKPQPLKQHSSSEVDDEIVAPPNESTKGADASVIMYNNYY